MLNGTKNRSQTTASTLARREGKFCHLSDWLVIERGCRIRCAWATGLSGWRLGPLCKDHSVWGFDGRAWGLWAQGVDTHGLSQPAGGHEARSHPWRPVRHPASQIWKGEDVGGGRWSQAKATWESRGADLLGLEQGRWKAGRVHWLGEGTGRGWVCKVELACSPKESIFHLVHVCVRAKMSVPTTLEKAQSIFRRQLGRQSTGPTRSITGATLTPEGFYAQCAGNAFASHQLQCCDYVRYNSHIMKLTILKGFQDVHQQWRLHRAEDRCWAPWKSLESKPVWPANLTWDSGLSLFLQSQAIWRKAETGELYQTQTLRNRGVRREGELTPLPEPWGSGPPGQGGTTHPLPLLSQDFGLCGVNRSWLFGGQGESRPPPAPLKGRQPLTTCCSAGCWWLQWGESWPLHEYWRLKFYIMILAGFVPIIEVKSCCIT